MCLESDSLWEELWLSHRALFMVSLASPYSLPALHHTNVTFSVIYFKPLNKLFFSIYLMWVYEQWLIYLHTIKRVSTLPPVSSRVSGSVLSLFCVACSLSVHKGASGFTYFPYLQINAGRWTDHSKLPKLLCDQLRVHLLSL